MFEEVFSYEHEPANDMSDLIMKIFPVSNVCEALWYLICLRRIWKPCISTALSFMHNYEVSGFTQRAETEGTGGNVTKYSEETQKNASQAFED